MLLALCVFHFLKISTSIRRLFLDIRGAIKVFFTLSAIEYLVAWNVVHIFIWCTNCLTNGDTFGVRFCNWLHVLFRDDIVYAYTLAAICYSKKYNEKLQEYFGSQLCAGEYFACWHQIIS